MPQATAPPNTSVTQDSSLVFQHMTDPLPAPYDAAEHWVKGDMVNTVSFARLDLPYVGKDRKGKRIYDIKTVPKEDFTRIIACVAFALFNINLDVKFTDKHN